MRLVLLAGCFWGAEHALREIPGISTLPVYAGGRTDPSLATYYSLDSTDHSEGVLVEFADAAALEPVIAAYMAKSKADPSPATRCRYRRAVLCEDEGTAGLVRSALGGRGAPVDVEVGFCFRPAEVAHVKRYARMMGLPD